MSIAQHRLARAMIVRRGPSGFVYLTRAAPGAVSPGNLPLIVRWSFLLFIGSLAIDAYSSAKLSGLLFFALYFLYHSPLSRKRSFPHVSSVMACFLIYIAIYALNGFFLPSEYLSEFFTRLSTLVQSIFVLWVGSDILKDEKMAKKALLTFSIASVIAAFGFVFSLPGFHVEGEIGTTRASGIGSSSFTLAIVVVFGLWLSLAHKRLITGVLMFVSMLALSTAIVYTGGRTAFLASMFGLSVYLVPYWKHRWRMSTVIVGIIVIAGLAYIAATRPVFYERWLQFSEEGDTSSRDTIYEDALDMIAERPLLGWQPIKFEYELGIRAGNTQSGIKAAHNIFLHLFMEVGVVGAVPFLVALWLCGQGAWKARNRNLGLLPLALFVATAAAGMASNVIYTKTLWLVFAVTLAARGERKRQDMILVGRPIEKDIQTSSGEIKFLNSR
jgi:O-antigen ligase